MFFARSYKRYNEDNCENSDNGEIPKIGRKKAGNILFFSSYSQSTKETFLWNFGKGAFLDFWLALKNALHQCLVLKFICSEFDKYPWKVGFLEGENSVNRNSVTSLLIKTLKLA